MTRELDSAHYLHRRRGLSLVVKPPVQGVVAMAWESGGHLVVGTHEGDGQLVHPALGTRSLWRDRTPVLGLGVSSGRVVAVESGGRWWQASLEGEVQLQADHPFVGPVDVQFDDRFVLLTGNTREERRTLFYEDGRKVFRIRLPAATVSRIGHDGTMQLAQSTPGGLEVIEVSAGARFESVLQTPHRLSAWSGGILGVLHRGVRVWRPPRWDHVDIALPGAVQAGLSGDGRYLAAGTLGGDVALVDLAEPGKRSAPDTVQVSKGPVRSLAFSEHGRWLAVGADALSVWSWE